VPLGAGAFHAVARASFRATVTPNAEEAGRPSGVILDGSFQSSIPFPAHFSHIDRRREASRATASPDLTAREPAENA
jgi:hypothetical protein